MSLSRFKIITDGNIPAPGKCAVCGSINGIFIDFGMDLDFYGVVIFCISCFGACATELDFRSPESVQSLLVEIKNLQDTNNDLNKLIGDLQSDLDILSHIDITRNSDGSFSLSVRKNPREIAQEQDTNSIEPDRGTTEREERSSKPTNEQGSSGLRIDDSIDSILNI